MTYPALDIGGVDGEWLLAEIDHCSPTALDERPGGITVFFNTRADRDRALEAVTRAWPSAILGSREVDDEDWARRSQENLGPVTVGRLVITPPWSRAEADRDAGGSGRSLVVITPSMGFGTGHHATTRLCLAAMQDLPLTGRTLLDVGTGSGVLAIAGRLLGARRATGIDNDPDAVQAAAENLADNPDASDVIFIHGDLRRTALEAADVVTANLTGALLVSSAPLLLAAVRPGGTLILSGLLAAERAEVAAAFRTARLIGESSAEDWVALVFNQDAGVPV